MRVVEPDVAVGPSLTSLIGANILEGLPGQTFTLLSRKAKPTSGFATIANLGDRPDTLAVRGSSGNALCGIAYFDDSGNVTAGFTSGLYRTETLDASDDAVAIRVAFSPNKKKLSKKFKRRGKTKYKTLKKTFPALIRADSTQGAASMDSATGLG